MHDDAIVLMENLLQRVGYDMELLQAQTAECMGDVRIVNALLNVQLAYGKAASAIKAALKEVK